MVARELIGQLRLSVKSTRRMSGTVLPMVQRTLQPSNHCQFRIINVAIELEYVNAMKDLANAMDLMSNLHRI